LRCPVAKPSHSRTAYIIAQSLPATAGQYIHPQRSRAIDTDHSLLPPSVASSSHSCDTLSPHVRITVTATPLPLQAHGSGTVSVTAGRAASLPPLDLKAVLQQLKDSHAVLRARRHSRHGDPAPSSHGAPPSPPSFPNRLLPMCISAPPPPSIPACSFPRHYHQTHARRASILHSLLPILLTTTRRPPLLTRTIKCDCCFCDITYSQQYTLMHAITLFCVQTKSRVQFWLPGG